jgi:Na+/melibiose symporter-like transporter
VRPSIGILAPRQHPSAARPLWTLVLAAAATYAGGRFLAGAVAQALGVTSAAFDVPGELVAAVLVGATLAALAPRLAGKTLARTGALGLVLFVSVAAVMLEGSAFAPSLSPAAALPTGLALQLAVSLVTARVAVAVSPAPAEPQGAPKLSLVRVAWRVGAAASVYVIVYFLIGAVSYALVTGPYYAAHAGGLTRPEPSLVLVLAVIEGFLMALGTIPLARRLAGSGQARGLACGLVLWVLGGVVPLLQASGVPDVVRVASAVEILFQKVPLGIAAVRLFGPSQARPTELLPSRGLGDLVP